MNKKETKKLSTETSDAVLVSVQSQKQQKIFSSEEKLSYLKRKNTKLENNMDRLLMQIFNDTPDNQVKDLSEQLTLRVSREGKLKYTTCRALFTYSNKNYYICEHQLSPTTWRMFVEEESELAHENPKIRVIINARQRIM